VKIAKKYEKKAWHEKTGNCGFGRNFSRLYSLHFLHFEPFPPFPRFPLFAVKMPRGLFGNGRDLACALEHGSSTRMPQRVGNFADDF